MWLLGGDAQKCKIEEANKHLAAMTRRIEELEKIVEDQKTEIAEKDERAAQYVKELTDNHYTEIADLKARIKDHASTIRGLQSDLKRRDTELNILKQRARMLDEVMRYKASLAKLTITLEQAEQYSKSVAGRVGLNDPRAAIAGGSSSVAVYTDPSPRTDPGSSNATSYYLVDEMPDEELIDRVSTAYVDGEKRAASKENGKPTLAEMAKAKASDR